MENNPRQWTLLGRSLLAMGLLSCLLFIAYFGHAIVTGVAVPYQDPTPEQVRYERFHNGISMPLFLGSALSILSTSILALAWASRSALRFLARSKFRAVD